jgi:hypothetical protein
MKRASSRAKEPLKPQQIARVLDLAIEHYLATSHLDGRPGSSWYSCMAVYSAAEKLYPLPGVKAQLKRFMRSMGLNPNATNAFREFELGRRRQQARALWLTWAALMARAGVVS